MNKFLPFTLGLLFFSFSASSFGQLNCALTYLTTIENFNVYKHNASGAILYRAKFSVDADGSPRAYGPNDSGLDWTANAGYPGNWWGVVTDANGDPVIQGSGDPYPGMYVSTTSLVQSGYATTNPLRYVNSEVIPYIALPSALQSLGNISKGDFAYVKNITNGDSSFAYFADSGPAGKLGEGSMFLATRLGLNNSPKNGGTSQQIIDYVVFPQSGFGQGTQLSAAQIDSIGEQVLLAAGGYGLSGCLDDQFTLNCSNTVPLTCGVTYNGTSSSAASMVSTYGCNNWTETGPERIHSIVPPANGTLTATLSNYTGDLDVYILAGCDPANCVGTVSSSSASFSNALAGVTYYIVVDADDGSGSAYDLVVACPASPCQPQTVNQPYAICSGDSIFLEGNYQETGGTYYDTLQTVSGCDSIIITELTVDSIAISINATADHCGLGNGTSTVIPGSGTSPYSYLWSDGQSLQTASGLSPGIYYVTVTDSIGCEVSGSIMIEPDMELGPIMVINNPGCFAGCDGNAQFIVPGLFSPAIYLWSNGDSGSMVMNLCAETYSVTATDSLGCMATAYATILEPALIDTNLQFAICFGDSIYLQENYQTTAGDYYDTLNTINGCDSIIITTLNINSNPIFTLSSIPDSGNASGTATATATGGSSPYSYEWSTGDTTSQISNLNTQIYYVTVTDANGCSSTDSVFVDFYTGEFSHISNLTSHVSIIPNPNDGKFTIQVSGNNQHSNYELQIINTLGEIVLKSHINNPQAVTEINLAKSGSGMYLIRLISDYVILQEKIAVH